ncbi:hypothetical protein [Mammaliicoccus lentus]|uniref:hypothetical protein n=1 Tax=Mammaliicoccus lentus TaxID=42858 RepID=UPI001C4EB1AF|nr:hypothetical protein [Mammaliicoccus lentus]MBW0761352.1 hypothetical protein [Mammaliicoccus lentus]
MVLSIIALIVSLVCLVASIIIYGDNNRIFKTSSNDVSINSVDRKLSNLAEKVRPLLDKHKEEQQKELEEELEEEKQKLIETRKSYWKSFNKWKILKERMNEDAEDTPICGACFNNSLELVVDYKKSTVDDARYGIPGYHVKKDYPLSAEQKCTVCGHVADKWEYEG